MVRVIDNARHPHRPPPRHNSSLPGHDFTPLNAQVATGNKCMPGRGPRQRPAAEARTAKDVEEVRAAELTWHDSP
jgi:hypothetical protein